MSELISSKEAKLAWAEGVGVQVATGPDKFRTLVSSDNLGIFDCGNYFRLKPRTVNLNGVEVGQLYSSTWDKRNPKEVIIEFKTEEDARHFSNNALNIFNGI